LTTLGVSEKKVHANMVSILIDILV